MRTLVRGYGKAVHTGTEEEKKPNGEGPKPIETLRMQRSLTLNMGECTCGCQ